MTGMEQRGTAKHESDPGLADYVAAAVRKFDPDHWLTALFAPDARRPHLLALYAFNVEIARIPEQVSEAALGDIRRQWWRDTVAAAFAGRAPRGHPVAAALEDAIRSHDLPQAPFERLLDARAADFDPPPARIEDLEAYAEGTAVPLGELALKILGAGDDTSRKAAEAAAVGFALIGLIRAVPFHAASRRLYLPQALLAAQGLDAEAVFGGDRSPKMCRVIEQIARQAENHLAMVGGLRGKVSRVALPALLPATLARLYLKRLKRVGFDAASPRFAVGTPRKQIGLLISAGLGRF